MRDPLERLYDILQAIEAIQRFQHVNREAFEQDDWNTVQQHMPVLKASVEALLRRLQNA